MSTTHTTFIIDSPIPLGRRISEIIHSKAEDLTQQELADFIGYSRPTLNKMLNGKRKIHDFELKRIADYLKIPMDRITMDDIRSEYTELSELLVTGKNGNRLLEIAEHLHSLAIGLTETSRSINALGCAYFQLGKYGKAHEKWLEAYPLSERITELYGEKKLLYRVLRNLMVSFIMRKEYSNAFDILSKLESHFQSNPNRIGTIHYTRAKICEDLGMIESARDHAYHSLSSFQVIGNQVSIGRAEQVCAHYEYLLGNYTKSMELLTSAVSKLDQDIYRKSVLKDLAKSLLKMNKNVEATRIIEKALSDHFDQNERLLHGKLKLLKALAKKDWEMVEQIVFHDCF